MPSSSKGKSPSVDAPRRVSQVPMKAYDFVLILEGPDILSEDALNALFAAGCDDATFGSRDGLFFGDFDREAASFSIAVSTAIKQVESAIPGLVVRRIEPDDLVTASVIAERTKRTRESIRLLVAGERGPGKFPAPVFTLENGTRLWRWCDIAAWFQEELGETVQSRDIDRFVVAMNAALELRRYSSQIADPDQRAWLASAISSVYARLTTDYDSATITHIANLMNELGQQYLQKRDLGAATRIVGDLILLYNEAPGLFNSQALNAMAYVYIVHRDVAQAIVLLNKGLEVASHAMRAIILYNLAIAMALGGNLSEAAAILDLVENTFEPARDSAEKPYAACLLVLSATAAFDLHMDERWNPDFLQCVRATHDAVSKILANVGPQSSFVHV